jgi:anti-sigma B factor antagonist
MDFSCHTLRTRRETVCFVAGEIDVATASVIERVATEALDVLGPCLAVNLSDVTFMDARGISTLLRLRKEAVSRGGYLRLAQVPPGVVRLLKITDMLELLAVPPLGAEPRNRPARH